MKLRLGMILVLVLLVIRPANAYSFNGTYTNIDGESVSFSTYSGKITMIEAFQSTCVHCRNPDHRNNMNIIYSKYNSQVNFLLLSVFGSDNLADVQEFISDFSVSWNAGLDSNDVLRNTFSITGTPTTLIVDENGDMLKRWVGHTILSAYTSVLNQYVDEPVEVTETETETDTNTGSGGGQGNESVISRLFKNPFFLGTLVLFVALSIFFRSFGKQQSP